VYLTPFSKSYTDGLSPWTPFGPVLRQAHTRTIPLENHHFGRRSACSQHSRGVASITHWLLCSVSTYSSQAPPFSTRWAQHRPAACRQCLLRRLKRTATWPTQFLQRWVLSSPLLVLDKSRTTHKGKRKFERATLFATTHFNPQALTSC